MLTKVRVRQPGERGMVTAELAVAIPAVVLVLMMCLAGLSAAVDQIRCVDAARIGARAAARGDALGDVQSVAASAAPPGAHVSVATGGSQAVVTVTATTGGWGGFLPRWDVSAVSRTPVERAIP